MNEDEGVWKVVESRRRRSRRVTVCKMSQHSCGKTENSDTRVNNNSAQGGYTYSVKHQPPEQTRDELVELELQKLEKLKCLLRETALWGRLVKCLHSALLQLGLEADHLELTDDVSGRQHSQALPKGERFLPTDRTAPTTRSEKHEKSSPETFTQAPPQARLEELVCYGIGSFSECHYARYQLALALCLRDLLSSRDTQRAPPAGENGSKLGRADGDSHFLEVPHAEEPSSQSPLPPQQASGKTKKRKKKKKRTAAEECGGSCGPWATKLRMIVFDPVMTGTDKAILDALGCSIPHDEKGKRCCGDVGEDNSARGSSRARTRATPTLFFMPHCPFRLYSNLLWANWSSEALGSIIILGNALSMYRDNIDLVRQADPSNALLRTSPLFQEIKLTSIALNRLAREEHVERLPHLRRAFNDLTLSWSPLRSRSTAAGVKALANRPPEHMNDLDL